MKKIGLVLALLTSLAAHAQPLYRVEIIVFARDTAEAETEENWAKQYDLRYPAQTVVLQPNDGTGASYQLLPDDALQLKRESTAIRQRRNFRVLAHQGWLQPLAPPAQAPHVFISGGQQVGAHRELEGTFAVGVEHFLLADANLWLSRLPAAGTIGDFAATPLPLPPRSEPATAQTFPVQTVVLNEQRRMRSGELHYFDHPKMGLLVLVSKQAEAAALTTPSQP